ncbi:MAG: hypothetical protein Q7V31_03695 [Parvibaculum sp.]|uniref:VpaChn25_0724 family phage protein n=1 Tax=Parvibaculum sp. TaxID=2024848 RepID=UPI002718451C|nr:hypothetical protein [Parvibaculum sp.]MDO8838006.1 hypothetical protein [Parvibaculum sp.]
MSFNAFLEQDRRLVILKSLAGQLNGTLNEVLIQRALDTFGHNVSRDAVKSQLRWLEAVDAVTLREASGYLIATLAPRGVDHLERRTPIDGIAKPSLGGA